MEEPIPEPQRKGRGEFFSIDRRTWATVCDFDTINAAVGYLTLAQGTIIDNRRTRWSKTSLKTYAGISWPRAEEALGKLLNERVVLLGEGHTPKKPRYELPTWASTLR